MFKILCLALFATGFAAVSSDSIGEEQKREQTAQQAGGGAFFGPQLLTEEEQMAYRARIRNAKSSQESEAIRAEHYALMKLRAKEKGVALPEQRPPVGGSMGSFFGPQLMSEEERAAYRAKLRSAKTKEASERIRTEQHQEIQARAKEKSLIQPQPETQASPNDRKPDLMGKLFGPQLLTEEEQMAYRARLRAAKTQEQRDEIRAQHLRLMQARAQEKGAALP